MNNIKLQKYYLSSNLERYINYQYKTNKNVIDVISEVNCNRDYDDYSLNNKADTSLNSLILVNKYYKLDEDYIPDDLIEINKKYSVKGMIKKEVADAFMIMCEDALKLNLHIINASSYRSYKRQKELYNKAYKERQEKADLTLARPGHSEHQTGLAMDFRNLEFDIDCFGNTEESIWLLDNAYKYGFILRYPKDKEHLTGYNYEPWHYRYVGVDAATYIHDNDITFDEYYAYFIENKKRD